MLLGCDLCDIYYFNISFKLIGIQYLPVIANYLSFALTEFRSVHQSPYGIIIGANDFFFE